MPLLRTKEEKIKRLKTDNGLLKFCNEEFNEFCKNEVIVQHRTIVGNSQKNGVVEQMNSLLEKVWCTLSISNAGLNKEF